MCKQGINLMLLVALFISCNQGKKSEKVMEQDSVATVAPVTVEDQNQLSEVITRFVLAYSSKDNAKANALIHSDLGIYLIYRPGVADTFLKMDSLDFAKPYPDHFIYPDFNTDYVLTYEKLPVFDCGTEKWDKLGFYCDTTMHPNQLSNIAAFEEEFNEQKLSDEALLEIEKEEKESFRIIVTTMNYPLVFHVRKVNGNWFVTTLDRAYAGCDA